MNEKDEANEEALLQSYIAGEDVTNEQEELEYLQARYEEVKQQHKALVLQRKESEAVGREDMLSSVLKALRYNHKTRVWIVKELRKRGATVEDRWVVGS